MLKQEDSEEGQRRKSEKQEKYADWGGKKRLLKKNNF